jgi:outer membrane lipoprotein carrier protein
MKKILFVFALIGMVGSLAAQKQDFTTAADNDPQAKAILEKVRTKYEGYKTIQADFSLTIELPEEPVETQKGKMYQEGDKYRLEMDAQDVVSDGESIWLYLKNNKEVQINNVEEEEAGAMMSPSQLLKIYDSKDFAYALVNEIAEGKKVIQQIEFKPLDEDAEFFKIRLEVDRASSAIKSIKAFMTDGSRFTLAIDQLTPNQTFATSKFVWSKSECPDCYVEDLRF